MRNFNKIFLCLATAPFLFACNNNKKEDETTKTYTVTINANGGTFDSTSSNTKTLSNCSTLAKADLEEPTRLDYGFNGWYLDSNTTNALSFPYTLTKDVTIYAGWSAEPTADFADEITETSITRKIENNIHTYTINGSTNGETPTITLSGCLKDGEIIVDVSKAYKATGGDININLNAFKIVSTNALPAISISKCDNKVYINSKEGTANYIYDARSSATSLESGDGAITSKSNLIFNGKGSLYINDKTTYKGYAQAIDCSKNVIIDSTNLKAYGVSTSIKGKRSITINDSSVTVYSKTGSGLKTSDEDVQDGVRCGDISINGDTSLTIAVAKHGISASHNLSIKSNSNGTPKISVYTSDYASSYVTISTPTVTEKDMYIYLPTSLSQYANQDNYRFAVLFSDGTWDNATLKKYHGSGQRLQAGPQPGPQPGQGVEGYYFGLDRPVSATTYQIYLFDSSHDENSSTEGEYVSKMTNASIFPSSGDTAQITALTDSITISSSFGTYNTMIEKGENNEKASYGCKGLTAGNEIVINNGVLNIKTKDDSINSKYGKLFPADTEQSFNRNIGTGNLTIDGNNTQIYITSADDAIHGTTVDIGSTGSPTINVSTSYEGLEGAIINYKNGSTSIYARDDGVNGANIGNISGTGVGINISGGYLDVQVASGDTDGIDSNNTYTQTGGIVVSRASSNNNMSTPLDTDGAASVSNSGIFIAIGHTPEANLSYTTYKSVSKSFSANSTYKINNTYTFKVTMSYSQYYYYLGSSASAPTID